MIGAVVPGSRRRAGSRQARRAVDAVHFRIVVLGGKVAQGCDDIADQRSQGWLFLDAHCSDGQGLVQSPCRVPALQRRVCHLGELPPVFEQGTGLKLRTNKRYINRDCKMLYDIISKGFGMS